MLSPRVEYSRVLALVATAQSVLLSSGKQQVCSPFLAEGCFVLLSMNCRSDWCCTSKSGVMYAQTYIVTIDMALEQSMAVLQAPQRASLTMQSGHNLPRGLKPLHRLHPKNLRLQGLPLQGSLTAQSAHSLPRGLKHQPRLHPSRLHLLPLHQASSLLCLLVLLPRSESTVLHCGQPTQVATVSAFGLLTCIYLLLTAVRFQDGCCEKVRDSSLPKLILSP